MSYEPRDAPDVMSRDGWIALAVILLACVGGRGRRGCRDACRDVGDRVGVALGDVTW